MGKDDHSEEEGPWISGGRYWYRKGDRKYFLSTPAVFRMKLTEDWTDYEAVMKEHPDLFVYDGEKDEWSLTEKGREAKGDLSKGEFNAHIVLGKYKNYKKFPEDRTGGEREFTAEEMVARGFTLI